jgi:ABC-type uncharacterized transport system involved in gliding motility auxiliary subunit
MRQQASGPSARKRASRHWLELGASVAVFLAILVVVQIVAERHGGRLDLTPSRRLSLSEPTRRILAEIDEDLTIEAFYTRWQREDVADLLQRLAHANPHVRYRLFDIDRYPERAQAAGIRFPDRARVTYRGVDTVVSTASEEYLMGGIMRVLRGRTRTIYFLQGHGERALGGPGESDGYWFVGDALGKENAVARALDLGTTAEIPADATTVVVAGPERDLLPEELDALAAYLDRGGAVLCLLDPGSLPRLASFLAERGIVLGDDVIVDRDNRLLGAEPLVIRVPYYRMHPVTAPSDVPAILVGARTVDTPSPGGRVQAVAQTIESSWATTEIDAAQRGDVSHREDRDRPGPLPVMVAASLDGAAGKGDGGRVVVIGDSDFAANGYIDLLGNRDLLLNSISWLTDEDALIAKRPRELAEIARPLSPLVLTERQAHALFLIVVAALPGLVMLVGTTVVLTRRRRG